MTGINSVETEKDIADKLAKAYRDAFDNFAGPPQFRHSCNYEDYHKAGLLGVYRRLVRADPGNLDI